MLDVMVHPDEIADHVWSIEEIVALKERPR